MMILKLELIILDVLIMISCMLSCCDIHTKVRLCSTTLDICRETMRVTGEITNHISGETRTIPSGVVIRPGTFADQPGIVELCKEVNFHNNWDYLPGLWNKFMKDPNALMIVAEKEGKLLAVSGMQVLNKGQSWLECGNRSSPTIRGNNVFWACNAHRITLALKRYDLPSNMCMVTGSVEDAMKARKNGVNYRVVKFYHYVTLGYRMTAEAVQSLSDHVMSVTSSVAVDKVQSADKFAELLSDPDMKFALFPEGYFKLIYSMYEAVPQSAYDVWGSAFKWAAISKTQQLTISLVSAFPVSGGQGIVFGFHLYGFVDYDVCMGHLKYHLPQMLNMYKEHREMYLVCEMPSQYCVKPYKELFHHQLKLESGGIIGVGVSMVCDPPSINI